MSNRKPLAYHLHPARWGLTTHGRRSCPARGTACLKTPPCGWSTIRKTLEQVAEKLATADAIGVDTESDSFYSYREKVCLLQISDLENDYIIDPLTCDDLSVLAPIMADERITKIFHGADYDVVSLKRDYDWKIHNIFDTMVSAQLLGMPKLGLADLIHRFFGIEIEKKYQRHDWSRRPLEPEHIEYARGDSHWLPALRRILTRNLRLRQRLAHVREECTLLEQRTWTPRPFDDNGYLYIKGASPPRRRGPPGAAPPVSLSRSAGERDGSPHVQGDLGSGSRRSRHLPPHLP